MKSNSDIVNEVYRNYKLLSLIKKLICDCTSTKSCKDMEQHIYLKLMTMDTFKLNELYYSKNLRKYITQMIKYGRNYYASPYNRIINTMYQTSMDELNGIEVEDKLEHDLRIDILFDIIENNKFGITGLTQIEMRKALSFEVYKFYLKTDTSMEKVGKKFNMCRSTVNTLIKFAKENLKRDYDYIIKNTDVYGTMG